jgi:hypothetical protein
MCGDPGAVEVVFTHTPMRFAALWSAPRAHEQAVARANPAACQPSRLHESSCQTMAIGWTWCEATSPVIYDLPLVRAAAGELAAATKVRLR